MYIDPRPPEPAENELAPRRSPLLPVVVFALCSMLAMAATVLLREHGVPVAVCGEDTSCILSGP